MQILSKLDYKLTFKETNSEKQFLSDCQCSVGPPGFDIINKIMNQLFNYDYLKVFYVRN